MSSMKLPPCDAVGEAPFSALLVWETDHHHEAHIPAKAILHSIVLLKIPVVIPPLVNTEAIVAPERR